MDHVPSLSLCLSLSLLGFLILCLIRFLSACIMDRSPFTVSMTSSDIYANRKDTMMRPLEFIEEQTATAMLTCFHTDFILFYLVATAQLKLQPINMPYCKRNGELWTITNSHSLLILQFYIWWHTHTIIHAVARFHCCSCFVHLLSHCT